MRSDVWSITPATDDDIYRASASIGGAGALTLLVNTPGVHGVGYKVAVYSTGDERTKNFTIVGTNPAGVATTEVLAGPNATATVTSVNYYAYVTSITIDAASVGNVKVGTGGSMAFPHTRIKAVQYAAAASAGTIAFSLSTGTAICTLNTPASAAATDTVNIPENGIYTVRGSLTDFVIVTLTNVTAVTIFCG